ncbi:MAG: GDP-mannose 4,6-dehydratase [Desulfomonile tiedjei]|nr:GDP-mannose 4,6-dehydratase [Desulfomonile tiedjei]
MANVVITGASGFVGANLARHLLGLGHRVNLILRERHADWRIRDILNDVIVHLADLRDSNLLTRVIKGIRPEWVFHLAAHGAYSSQSDARQILETNLMGTVNLVHACMETEFEVLVNTGSSSEYGFKDHAPTETEMLEPNSYYAVGKASATMLCGYIARSRGVRIPTLRLYSVYGPYEEPTRLMPTLVLKGLQNALPPLVDPDIARDFVYVDDVVQAYLLAAMVQDQDRDVVYNVGTGVQTSIREVVAIARRQLNITTEPKWASMTNRIWDTGTWVSDSGLIKQKLEWRPRYSFEQGFSKMVEWFGNNPVVMKAYRSSI